MLQGDREFDVVSESMIFFSSIFCFNDKNSWKLCMDWHEKKLTSRACSHQGIFMTLQFIFEFIGARKNKNFTSFQIVSLVLRNQSCFDDNFFCIEQFVHFILFELWNNIFIKKNFSCYRQNYLGRRGFDTVSIRKWDEIQNI